METTMISETNCENVGSISFLYNRIYWIVPKFYDLKMWSWFRSAPFSLCGSIWRLQFRCAGSAMKKEWLEITVKHLTKSCAIKGKSVRFGIAGSSHEISKVLEASDTLQFSPLSLSSDLKFQTDEWMPGGSLQLFFAIEVPSDVSNAEIIQEVKSNIGRDDVQQVCGKTYIDACSQTEAETGVWSLQQQLREILENGNVSDIVVRVSDQELKAHRCILAARSPVFLAMMTHDTKEKNTGVLDLEDIESDSFCDFLRYLYTGGLECISSQNVTSLYTAADKYQVQEMKDACIDYMLKNISVDNFCDILTLSLRHVEKNLIDACTLFFVENALALALTPKWQVFLRENPVAGNELYIKQLQKN